MADSIHTARWVNQISDQGWDIHLFPCAGYGAVHPGLNNVTAHRSINTETQNWGISAYLRVALNVFIDSFLPDGRLRQLRRLIKKLEPDIIHSLEFQHAGYLTFQALYQDYTPLTARSAVVFFLKRIYYYKNAMRALKKPFYGMDDKKSDEKELETPLSNNKRLAGKSSKWIATNWGSDIYLFGRLAGHAPKIKQVLAACDYYSCECQRDVALARSFGFKGEVLPVFPNTGGFDLEKIFKLRQHGPISKRRLIMLKGYQGWAYRGLVGLRALERCADLLKGYTVAIYLGFTEEMQIAAELFTQSTGIPVKMIPYVSHDEMLRYHGQARVSIGLAISDAISTSFLEAMVMGSFPIQSNTACADEWIEDGRTGILVPPEDPDVIEKAIRRALTDDDLVDRAAEENWKTAAERLDYPKIRPKAVDFYKRVFRS